MCFRRLFARPQGRQKKAASAAEAAANRGTKRKEVGPAGPPTVKGPAGPPTVKGPAGPPPKGPAGPPPTAEDAKSAFFNRAKKKKVGSSLPGM